MFATLSRSGLRLALLALSCLGALPALSQVVAVAPVLDGRTFSTDSTKTFLWEGKDAAATLLFIPGGDGRLGLADDKKDLGGFYGSILKPLSDPRLTAGRLNVVVFDSPKELALGARYPSSRATADHLMRIESVVRYYAERLHKPVWLMGHSNGAASITEFYKYLQKKQQSDLVAGLVFSAGRDGADFNAETTNLPVLFLAHIYDGCRETTNTKSLFERLKRVDKARVDYVPIKGGSAEGDPCRSGFHMYFGASAEAYKPIDSFIGDFYR